MSAGPVLHKAGCGTHKCLQNFIEIKSLND